MNIKLTISYDGSRFYGSQIQKNKPTIHGCIYTTLKTLGINSKISFSGRTDKNVHAFYQVLSFTLPSYWDNISKLRDKLEDFLPNSIKILNIKSVDDNFHARFSAKTRSYRYIISKEKLTPFNSAYISYYSNIDIALIKKASKYFVGVHDFEYFHKKGSEPYTTIREIYSIIFYEYKNIFVFKFKANSYLRSQIRMMVYFLLKISSKELTIDELVLQLSKKKMITNRLASPNGLYLSKVTY